MTLIITCFIPVDSKGERPSAYGVTGTELKGSRESADSVEHIYGDWETLSPSIEPFFPPLSSFTSIDHNSKYVSRKLEPKGLH